MTVEEMLIQAAKSDQRMELIREATSIRRYKEYMTQLDSYEEAYSRIIQRTQ